MPITNFSRVKTIVVPLMASTSNVVTIYESNGLTVGNEFFSGHTIVSFNAFIKNLKVFASISSLETAPLPDFKVTDSQTQKLVKTLDIEWGSPRKQLNLFIGTQGSNWLQVGSISLLNPYGYPYRVYNLLDLFTDNLALELGENSKIGVAIQNVGHGLLADQDSVTIHGSYVEEIFVKFDDPLLPPINIYNQISGVLKPETNFESHNETNADNQLLAGN